MCQAVMEEAKTTHLNSEPITEDWRCNVGQETGVQNLELCLQTLAEADGRLLARIFGKCLHSWTIQLQTKCYVPNALLSNGHVEKMFGLQTRFGMAMVHLHLFVPKT